MDSVITMAAVSKSYPHFTLGDIDLTVARGQVMGLVGINGAGKSTIIRILMGLVEADKGEVAVLGYRLPEDQISAKREVGYASEDMRLYKSKTLSWHMDFIRGLFPRWDSAYAEHLLKKFDLRGDQDIKGFSHGQRVKASLLLLLARRPDLLILDEPTTGLDPVARSEVVEELAEVLRDENRSVLFSSHNTHDIEQLSDSITFIHDGQLLASEDIGKFLNNWRCIRCKGQIDPRDILLPDLVEARVNGSLINLKVENFKDTSLDVLRAQGLEILDVMQMNLEEIFVANIRAKMKKGVA